MTTLSARIHDQAQQYRKLSHELALETNVKMQLESCMAERDRLTQKIKSKQVELNQLTENSKKEFDDVRKLRHLSVKSVAATLKGQKKEKAAMVEARYQQSFEEEQKCKREIEELSRELGVLSDTQEQLGRQASHMRTSREQLKRILDDVFAVADPNYPLEPQLKAEVHNYINQQASASRDLGRFRDADHNLTYAKREINKVLRLLDTAISYIPFDLFGANMLDAHQAACLEGAKRQTYEVQRRLNVARQILPEIPHQGLLDVVTNNLVLSMQVNLNYVDMAWKAKAQHAYALMVTCQKNIDASLQWVRHYMRYTEGALDRLKVAIESTQNALDIERCRIVDGVLAGSPVDGMAGIDAQAEDQPPPMYESPPDANLGAQAATIPSIPSNVHLPPPSPSPTFENISPAHSDQRPPSQPPTAYPSPAAYSPPAQYSPSSQHQSPSQPQQNPSPPTQQYPPPSEHQNLTPPSQQYPPPPIQQYPPPPSSSASSSSPYATHNAHNPFR